MSARGISCLRILSKSEFSSAADDVLGRSRGFPLDLFEFDASFPVFPYLCFIIYIGCDNENCASFSSHVMCKSKE